MVGTFPNRRSVMGLLGATLGEQTEEWAIAKRYMSVESLKAPVEREPSLGDPWPAIEAAMDAAAG
jgi:putative transposase